MGYSFLIGILATSTTVAGEGGSDWGLATLLPRVVDTMIERHNAAVALKMYGHQNLEEFEEAYGRHRKHFLAVAYRAGRMGGRPVF